MIIVINNNKALINQESVQNIFEMLCDTSNICKTG